MPLRYKIRTIGFNFPEFIDKIKRITAEAMLRVLSLKEKEGFRQPEKRWCFQEKA